MAATLLSLPPELLSLIPQHLNNIETFTNASSTCRHLRSVFSTTLPRTIFHLAAASAPTFFSPHPHFLLMAVARQLGDWAFGNAENTARLQRAFQGGVEGLLEFCLDDDDPTAPRVGITMEQIRRLHLARFEILNPLADKIDKMAGEQWYQSAEDFWDGGVSEPNTVYVDVNRATLQLVIYGELFGRGREEFLNPELHAGQTWDLQTRLEYIKYCIPDWVCRSYPGVEFLPVGPYAPERRDELRDADQYALRHILLCRRWRRMWAEAMEMVGPPFAHWEDEKAIWDWDVEREDGDRVWRLRLFRNALQTRGLEGMQMVTLPKEKIKPEVLEAARVIRGQIERLEKPPDVDIVGDKLKAKVSKPLDPANEVYVCMATYWSRGTR
ncbi:hypothetical protein FQN50_003566 [Emmonsiellopsis sp. PD_5]|nr:hypothetical protein FQN50_003566 [Emmonsiellopsis sp. PD_5]